MRVAGEKIEPFYFSSFAEALFGLYHVPRPASMRDCAIVLCYPMGHEYIQFHRAFRLLAERLCSVGFPVLRFDFYGCGDSSGESEEGRIDQWLADISTAMSTVRQKSGLFKVCLIGLRLGASLSMIAGAERGDVDGLVLWDPVINGKAYLEELKTVHQQMLRKAHVVVKHGALEEGLTEVLGFPLTDQMRTDLEKIDLLGVEQKPATNILILRSHPRSDAERLRKHLEPMCAQMAYEHLPNPQLWKWREDFGKILVPPQILQSIVRWVSEIYS